MSSLALILKAKGDIVFGLDKSDFFSSQNKLIDADIKIYEDFNLDNIIEEIDYVIYSTAYENSKIVEQLNDKYISYSYIDYLSKLTRESKAYGICGTHGKTTTSAATTFALSYKNRKAFPFYSIFGSSLIEDPYVYQGDESLVIEACEYQDHFLKYNLRGAIITSIDFDHPDYFKDETAVLDSFIQFALNIRKNGFLILNVDDKNVRELKSVIENARDDLNIISFGFMDNSIFRIQENNLTHSYNIGLTYGDDYKLNYTNRALVNDMVGASILATCILLDREKVELYLDDDDIICDEVFTTLFKSSLNSLEYFTGVRGRLELKVNYKNIVFIDDYAHHPKEIYTLLQEVKSRYPNRKVFAIFSFHTASRTKALYKDFLNVFLLFDKLIITKTFASARMDIDSENLDLKFVKDLNKKLLKSFKVRLAAVQYIEDIDEVASISAAMIEDGDIVISLGASNNDDLYKNIIKELDKR